jgi:uncharacterized protein (TIGR02597 family)
MSNPARAGRFFAISVDNPQPISTIPQQPHTTKPMKLPAKLAIASMALAALATSATANTTATTDPVGFSTVVVKGKATPTSANRNTYIGIPMAQSSSYQGVIGTSTVSGGVTVVTFPSSVFTANQFNGTGNDHYFQVTSGPNNGLVSTVTATSTDSLTLADDISSVLSDNSTTFKVVPYWTLGKVFPNGAGLTGGISATAADTVTIIPPTGGSLTYFYNTNANEWRRGTTPSSNVIIPPGSGLLVTRKQAGDVNIVVAGAVPLGPVEGIVGAASPTASRNSLLANAFPLPSVTLANSGLYSGDPSTGVAGGISATAADTVVILDPNTGSSLTYFYNTTANEWRRGTTPSGNVTIPEGAAILVTRKAGRGEFSWYAPQPSMNLN